MTQKTETTGEASPANPGTVPAERVLVEGSALLTKEQLAPRLHRTTRTVDSWMRAKIIPYVKLPGRRGAVYFRWADVLEALGKYRVG